MLKFIFLSLFVTVSSFATDMNHPLDRAFVPKGFDNDDSIQIVVTGNFQKSCLQLGYVTTMVDHSRRQIFLQMIAYEYPGKCVEGGAPFHHVVHLGRLNEVGPYDLVDRTSGRNLGALIVDKASDTGVGTDNEPYANLSDAFLATEDGANVLVLRGIQIAKCAPLGEVEFRAQSDVLVVLPKTPKWENVNCAGFPGGYERRIPVDKTLPTRPFLLHVRAMGGQAINKMVY